MFEKTTTQYHCEILSHNTHAPILQKTIPLDPAALACMYVFAVCMYIPNYKGSHIVHVIN
jgi:hypothetical protein